MLREIPIGWTRGWGGSIRPEAPWEKAGRAHVTSICARCGHRRTGHLADTITWFRAHECERVTVK